MITQGIALEGPAVLETSAAIAPEAPGAIEQALCQRIGVERFELWFDRKTRFEFNGDELTIHASSELAANWIRGKFLADVRAAAETVMNRPVDVSVRVSEMPRCRFELTPPGTPPAPSAPPGLRLVAGVLNPKYLLEDFVAGASNELALRAATQVAARPGEELTPLFIHGHCGLGKTHLLQGICARFGDLHPNRRWVYVTGEQFTNEFLEAIRRKTTDAFRKRIRVADLLVIDDVHFLANKKATQEEFLHAFNHIDASGRQVVLASDCQPGQIHQLAESLSSRFVSGMVVRIDPPDLPTRLEILRRRAARMHWSVSDAVLMHIAQSPASSVREIEGLLLQVVAGLNLLQADRGAADAAGRCAAIVGQIRQRTASSLPVGVDRIVAAVGEYFSITSQEILGNGKERLSSNARAIAMHLARRHTSMSFPEIGRALGNKNHSTVIAACQRVEAHTAEGKLLCWNTPDGPRHQTMADVVHEIEGLIRRSR